MSDSMNILLVEDNDLDVEILKRGLKKIGAPNSFVRARDGIEALDILTNQAENSTLEEPFVILLDINMPRMNGHEFLEALKEIDALAHARVFIFTTSDNQKDIMQAYQNQACGYIVKPNDSSELNNILRTLKQFWDICEHPARIA